MSALRPRAGGRPRHAPLRGSLRSARASAAQRHMRQFERGGTLCHVPDQGRRRRARQAILSARNAL